MLFLAVLLDVSLGGLIGVVPRMSNVPTRQSMQPTSISP
jgi:hypothetical protein